MKTCYIYLRVSTMEQASEGFSIENQKRACVDFANNNGYHIERIFTEDGKSARTTERPAFQEMFSLLKQKPIHAIIFFKIDRLFRNVADFSTIRKELKKYGH